MLTWEERAHAAHDRGAATMDPVWFLELHTLLGDAYWAITHGNEADQTLQRVIDHSLAMLVSSGHQLAMRADVRVVSPKHAAPAVLLQPIRLHVDQAWRHHLEARRATGDDQTREQRDRGTCLELVIAYAEDLRTRVLGLPPLVKGAQKS